MIEFPATAQTATQHNLLDLPAPTPLTTPARTPPVRINGFLYTAPTRHDIFTAYLQDTYGINSLTRTSARALYAFTFTHSKAWDQDAGGFGIRFASAYGVNMVNGNVRLGMDALFHEDLRYIPCRGCRKRDKLVNALLAEVTARHSIDGHRFFTLTPTVSDFSGPLIAHVLWYPNPSKNFTNGIIDARTVFATRIAGHLFREFVVDRHKHKPRPDESVASLN